MIWLIVGPILVGLLLIRTTGSWWTWRGWVALSLLGLLVGSVVYGQLDGLLRGMHIFGGPHYGISNVAASPFHPSPLPAPTVVQTWLNWYTQPDVRGIFASPRHVATLALLVDWFILIPSYGLLLALLLHRGRGVLEAAPPARRDAHTGWTLSVRPVVEHLSVWGMRTLGVAVAADVLENFVTLSAINGYSGGLYHPSWLLWALPYITLIKFLGIGFALLCLLMVGLALVDLHRDQARQLYRAFVALRAQLVLLGVLAVAVLFAPPALDAIRGLGPVQWSVTIVVALALAWVTWAFGRRVLPDPEAPPDRGSSSAGALLGVGGGFLLLAVVPRIWGGFWWGAFIPAGFWILVGLTALRWPSLHETSLEKIGFGRRALPRALGAAVLVLIGLATLKASVGNVVLTPKSRAGGILVVLGIGFVLAGWGLQVLWATFLEHDAPQGLRSGAFPWVVGGALGLGALLWVRLVLNVWAVADSMGTIAIVLAFLMMASILVGVLVLVAERVNPPNLFRLLGFTRIPVFVLFFGWFFLASYLPTGSGYHDVRYLSASPTAGVPGATPLEPGRGATVADVFRQWLANQAASTSAAAAGTSAPSAGRTRIPLLLVATSGGGIKAAYWTATVLDCVLDAAPVSSACSGGRDLGARPILAASGISGGSLGLVEFVADQVQRATGKDPGGAWVHDALGGDYQSPTIAWQLGVEFPRAFLRFDTGMDRAEVLERAWQQAWATGPWTASAAHLLWGTSGRPTYEGPLGVGLRRSWYDQASSSGPSRGAPIPLMILNGTSVSDGCRFNTSVLDGHGPASGGSCQSVQALEELTASSGRIFPSTRDIDDSIADSGCGSHRDVRLSTAALLSARFPFVSPSGRLTLCRDPRQAAFVVDGGYLDGSGASTILDLWQVLDPLVRRYNAGDTVFGGDPANTCLVPYLIQIDSGYAEPVPEGPTKRPHELRVPSQTQSAARGAVSSSARQEAGLLFATDPGGVYGEGRYAQFYLRGHPGVEAPLAWVLSRDAATDLVAQLKANVSAINTVEAWLQPGQPC